MHFKHHQILKVNLNRFENNVGTLRLVAKTGAMTNVFERLASVER